MADGPQEPTHGEWEQQQVGTLLGGRYELRRVLGSGGMGVVYLARDNRLPQDVAVKVLYPNLASDPTVRRRFDREASTVVGLDHPYIVEVTDTNHADDRTGLRYIVMKYIKGHRTLADELAAGPLSVERAVSVVGDVLEGLAHAHAAGVVHRDVKPANVMITTDGRAKVVDFGIALVASMTMSLSGSVRGTPHYMAPEQALNKTVDARADLYSTGCLLFRALTGRPPFVGETMAALLLKHRDERPPAPTTLRTDLPTTVNLIVAKAMAKQPDDRYQTADEFRIALASLMERAARPDQDGRHKQRRAVSHPVTSSPAESLEDPFVLVEPGTNRASPAVPSNDKTVHVDPSIARDGRTKVIPQPGPARDGNTKQMSPPTPSEGVDDVFSGPGQVIAEYPFAEPLIDVRPEVNSDQKSSKKPEGFIFGMIGVLAGKISTRSTRVRFDRPRVWLRTSIDRKPVPTWDAGDPVRHPVSDAVFRQSSISTLVTLPVYATMLLFLLSLGYFLSADWMDWLFLTAVTILAA
ncbi:MAG: protein kinase [Micrococcales bacterium]|nr:protein kinase [Micrococcales bacterium]